MTPSPPIKRHEVFLIIGLLAGLTADAAGNDWAAVGLYLTASGYLLAAAIMVFTDKTP